MHSKLSDSSSGLANDQRNHLLAQVKTLERQAEEAAQAGELADSARAILAALDCERRAGSLGPQVLQLIKPRN
jgi:hypothetical protein